MAERIVFSPPDGASDQNARIDDIVQRVLNGDAAYWRAGAAHATVYYAE